MFTTSLNSCGCLYDRCLLSMLPSDDPLLFIRLIVSQNQAVWARASGTDWVKSAVDISSSALYRLNYSYSFWRHNSSEYEYIIRTTIRNRSEYDANIWYIHNGNDFYIAMVTRILGESCDAPKVEYEPEVLKGRARAVTSHGTMNSQCRLLIHMLKCIVQCK